MKIPLGPNSTRFPHAPPVFPTCATRNAPRDARRCAEETRNACTLIAPGCKLPTNWLQALPLFYTSYTAEGFRISVFRAVIEPLLCLGALCAKLNAVGVRRVPVEGNPTHFAVAMGCWHRLFAQFPSVTELLLYPGTAKVIRAAHTPPCVIQSLKRVYVVEGTFAEPPNLSKPNVTSETDLSGVLSEVDLDRSPSPPGLFVVDCEPEENWREELELVHSHSLDVRPGLMALLRGGATPSSEVHLWNCEVEPGPSVAGLAMS